MPPCKEVTEDRIMAVFTLPAVGVTYTNGPNMGYCSKTQIDTGILYLVGRYVYRSKLLFTEGGGYKGTRVNLDAVTATHSTHWQSCLSVPPPLLLIPVVLIHDRNSPVYMQ